MNFRERLKDPKILLLDGAMGTQLMAAGETGVCPEALNLTRPELVRSIHERYLESGAEVLYANTFGANGKKLPPELSVEEAVTAGVRLCREAAKERAFVALDLGPIGELLAPMGSLEFEEAVRIFARTVRAGAAAGCDLVAVETVSDLNELRAALLAVRENSDLPVICTMTFETADRTFTGTSAACFARTAEALGADAVGVNCSFGPDRIAETLKIVSEHTALPLIAKPNAGLPRPGGGFDLDAGTFCRQCAPFFDLGVRLIGGCCGTSPDFIRGLRAEIDARPPFSRPLPDLGTAVCSASSLVRADFPVMVGERLNPTGKKKLKEALAAGDMDFVAEQALDQQDDGAMMLDVNAGLPGADEAALLTRMVREVGTVCRLPLQLDSGHPAALEAALRIYAGRAMVNSVTGEDDSLDAVLPLVKKYGASVIGLTLDRGGIPADAEGRVRIAEKIVRRAEDCGIPRRDVVIDCLTLTVSAEPGQVRETLTALRRVKAELGVRTMLGVSNISFGLPDRESVNAAFLAQALEAGLDFVIMNPGSERMRQAFYAGCLLAGRDPGAKRFLAAAGKGEPSAPPKAEGPSLYDCVLRGLKEAGPAARALLADLPPMEVINGHLIPALDEVGRQFEVGKLFLPQLLASAEAAGLAFEELRQKLEAAGEAPPEKGPVVLATVEGDVHDIGKNIVKAVLKNYGFAVIDLGKNVPAGEVVRAVKAHSAPLLGLSALMTTTLPAMEATVRAVREAVPDCRIMVGGAVLTPEYAQKIGADFYAKDASASADFAKRILP